MNNEFVTSIRAWVDANLFQVSIWDPVSTHVNQLMGAYEPEQGWFAEALCAFSVLVEYVHTIGDPAQPAIGITLREGERKVQQDIPRSVQDIEGQWRNVEPPSLYMLDWNICKSHIAVERYHVPLAFSLMMPAIDGVYATYEEVRSTEDARSNEPFARFVMARYVPKKFRPS